MKSAAVSPGWRRILARWLPLLLWMAIIFAISHRPSSGIPDFGFWDKLIKKSGHFLGYAVLAVLAYRVTVETERPALWAIVITAIYAAGDEFHQTFVDGRQGNVVDVLIDCAGGLAGLYLMRHGSRLIGDAVKKGVNKEKEYGHS